MVNGVALQVDLVPAPGTGAGWRLRAKFDQLVVAGKPFVGPAGRVLDDALEQAGIPRGDVFVTNAVKHFKHEMRGKRRLHKRPNAYEIERCRWWLEQERAIVRPAAIVALGATAARSVFGRVVTITKMRGQAHPLEDGTAAFVTIHPSFLLRIEDDADKEREYRNFVADLRRDGRGRNRQDGAAGRAMAARRRRWSCGRAPPPAWNSSSIRAVPPRPIVPRR